MSDRRHEQAPHSVGELRDPQPDDARYGSQVEAEAAARTESYPGRVLGIWHDKDGELVAVAYDGYLYWP